MIVRDEKEEGDWYMVCYTTLVGFSRGGMEIRKLYHFLIEVGLLSRLEEWTGD